MDKRCRKEIEEVLGGVGVTGVIVSQVVEEINEAYIKYRRRRVVERKKWFAIFEKLKREEKENQK